MALARLTEVEGENDPGFRESRDNMPPSLRRPCHRSPCQRSRSVSDQLVPVRQPQEMQYPGYAGLDGKFRKFKLRCDVAITEAFADQAINWAQHSRFFPKDTHEVNLRVRIMPAVAVTICSKQDQDAGHLVSGFEPWVGNRVTCREVVYDLSLQGV